jgi:hypothetical protein
MTRSNRSKVLETKTGHVPGPGAYEVGEPIHDYQGVYKNMGKKKTKKAKKGEAKEEGSEAEQEEEREKDSEGSENDE